MFVGLITEIRAGGSAFSPGRYRRAAILCWLTLGLATGALSAAPADPAGKPPPIKSIQQFWDRPSERANEPIDYEIDCVVTYFDSAWKILFVQDSAGTGAYVKFGANPFAFKSGAWITARGTLVPPHSDVSFEHATITPRTPGNSIPPLDVTRDVTDFHRLATAWVAMEGYVDSQRRGDAEHLQLYLTVNGEAVNAWVLMPPDQTTPDFSNQKIRIEGVYNPTIGPGGQLQLLELMSPSPARITVLGKLADHPGFALPITPVNQLASSPGDQPVRVAGTVVARELGHWIRLRDGSGLVEVRTGQSRPADIEDFVEAVGYPSTAQTPWQLRDGLFRTLTAPEEVPLAPGEAAGTLKRIATVLKLSPDEAAQGRPVSLTGVVTWSHRTAPFFFIQDASGGVRVQRGDSPSSVRSPGRKLEVHGVTAMGAFSPVVRATTFERVSDVPLPVARPVSVEHALTGVEEGNWIELRGFLRRTYVADNWNYLEIAGPSSDFIAVLPPTDSASEMVGSVIRVRGVCTAEADPQRRLTGIKLWVPGINHVQIEEPAPADLFSVPARSLASVGQYEAVQAFNRRVRVDGVVLHSTPGHSLWLAEGGHSLLVLTQQATQLQVGDRVETVGFLGRQGGRVTLREAVYRPVRSGPPPPAQPLDPEEKADVALDGKLVSISGTLLESTFAAGQANVSIQTPRAIFTAAFGSAEAKPIDVARGSVVTVTGVYEVNFDERGRPESFKLRARNRTDLQVVEAVSWWTRPRILGFTGVLALGALAFIAWITVLRRQVQRQTGLIRVQMERETKLQVELARASKLESLGLLAGGIAHDFNNLLTVMMGNISLIRLEGNLSAESAQSLAQSEKAAIRARDLTQQLLTFAKGGAPLRTAVSLPEVVREVAEFAVRGSKVRCNFKLSDGLWPANVDKGQIGQVVQNIVINATQAMPQGGEVDLTLSNAEVGRELEPVLTPGRYVRLDIRDYGAGIAAEDLSRIFDPYFTTKKQGSGLGLATVHSIVKKHAGHVTVESLTGHGTTFRIWLPAATDPTPVAARPVTVAPFVAPPRAMRVLFMDDEEFIRNLGGSILRRLGYEPTMVEDGQAALDAFDRARGAKRPFDLVILDLTIPGGMGGRQTLQELLKRDPAVKAIVSSGYSNDLVLSDYVAHGFCGMISKPYDIANFAHAVEQVLQGQRA